MLRHSSTSLAPCCRQVGPQHARDGLTRTGDSGRLAFGRDSCQGRCPVEPPPARCRERLAPPRKPSAPGQGCQARPTCSIRAALSDRLVSARSRRRSPTRSALVAPCDHRQGRRRLARQKAHQHLDQDQQRFYNLDALRSIIYSISYSWGCATMSVPNVTAGGQASRRDFLKLGGMAGGAALLGIGATACGSPSSKGAAAAGKPRRGGTLKVGILGGSSSDTVAADVPVATPDYARLAALYNTLTTFDLTGNIVPVLAETVEYNSNASVYTIRLRQAAGSRRRHLHLPPGYLGRSARCSRAERCQLQ
jgi:hypothetical protein